MLTGFSSQNSAPLASMARSTVLGSSSICSAATWGMLILIECASSGAVMMKITSSTSMTSIRAPC